MKNGNRRFYPPQSYWYKLRRELLEQSGHKCVLCGAPNAEIRYNPKKSSPLYEQGEPHCRYLVLAHKNHYERWRYDASVLLVCYDCHGVLDAELRRKAASHNYAPIGECQVWVHVSGQRYIAAAARRYDDLFEAVACLEPGTTFELCAEIMLSIAGRGFYRRVSDGIEVVKETGVCRSFSAYLQDVLTGVLA